MPYYKEHMRRAIEQKYKMVKEGVYTVVDTLHADVFVTPEPVSFAERTSGRAHYDIKKGEVWGKLWDCGWFHFTGSVPKGCDGKYIVLLIDIAGEGCIMDENGEPVRGITAKKSSFDDSLGAPTKRVYRIFPSAKAGEKIDVWMDAGCNDLFGNDLGGTVEEIEIAVLDEERRALYYDMMVLIDLWRALPADSARAQKIFFKLYDAATLLGEFTPQEIASARRLLKEELDKKNGDTDLQIWAVGHAHLDLAWLWPIRESIRKAARTFSTALYHIDLYDDYVFGQSQPQQYEWMKQHYPGLYARIKQAVADGRIEPQGCMWVEADTNISSGEALVRQIYYGTKFFRDEFGKEINNLWLPDVFGYNAALPQILKKSGIDYFMTQKLSWSEHNKFPHHTFRWEGIDGTEILTHMLPEETYNGPASPRSVCKTERQYQESGICSDVLMLYGIGDGGAGPGSDHIERLMRMKNLSGIAPVKMTAAGEIFPKLAKSWSRLPKWQGELYLERHQGTLTTQGRNKRFNRKMEYALREMEFAYVFSGQPFPKEEAEKIWKEVLLYQFHDIIPGSSIDRVYDESLARYACLSARVKELTASAYEAAAKKTGAKAGQTVYFNSLSWDREQLVSDGTAVYLLKAPAVGAAVLQSCEKVEMPLLAATDNILENAKLKVVFAPDGSIQSMICKENGFDACGRGERLNILNIYEDDGDCWDIPITYQDKAPQQMKLVSRKSYIDGINAVMEQVYTYGKCTLNQKAVLAADAKRLDFVTEVDWDTYHRMLRSDNRVNVFSERCTYDIQYGTIRRSTTVNTSWDMAKFEVCGIKFADLSDREHGVAILSDCKDGYKVKDDNFMSLNLLRAPTYPGKHADIGHHSFTYSIYPHAGDVVDGKVMEQAYELNIPMQSVVLSADADERALAPMFEIETLRGAKPIVEAVKPAEAGNGVILRFYENSGMPISARFHFEKNYREIVETNLMEKRQSVIAENANEAEFTLHPFEIKTILLNEDLK